MLQLTHVSKYYHGQDRVLNDVSFELKKGEFLYVVGGSGAGKSSLLRMIATEEAPTQGVLSLFGYDLRTVSPGTLRSIRQALGFIPQDVRLVPDLSVSDNVALALTVMGSRGSSRITAELRHRVEELLDRLGLADKRDKLACDLSGGEAQRVAVARALARQPELIVADEPTGAQDRDFTWSMMDLFMRANAGGATVVLATHDREIVRRVRKKCAVLSDGRLGIEEATACFY